jgi:Uma2 family endonuclease
MVILEREYVTAAAFDAFINAPENKEFAFEYINGRIVAVVSNQLSSVIGLFFGGVIMLFVRKHKLGYTTGSDGGYWVAGERYMPDCGFISKARQPKPVDDTWNPLAPDLAVEVISPSNADEEMRIEIANYLSAGTVVWVANSYTEQVEVYVPGKPVQVLRRGDVLTGGDVLPGFEISIIEIFDMEV